MSLEMTVAILIILAILTGGGAFATLFRWFAFAVLFASVWYVLLV